MAPTSSRCRSRRPFRCVRPPTASRACAAICPRRSRCGPEVKRRGACGGRCRGYCCCPTLPRRSPRCAGGARCTRVPDRLMWTAITLWIAGVAGSLLYTAVALRNLPAQWLPALWLPGLLVIYFAMVSFLCTVYFAVAWLWRARRPREVRIGPRATARLVWREYRTLAGAAPRMMFYGLLVRDPAPARIETPVILLHGVL